ncbi:MULTISPECIES: hypothetical protein [unclassified Shinella]|uniref:hypothetical protein n=1 Tax=unclassified Shinella TaxID=2643062 RepID=UPI00225C9498|nr:hypothetical protein [Shinella sp. YE25]MDC7259514.1 hypothetical protein [Shinella sp. YE25]CAI0341287.1 conserved hypothetical protein [Rhizobiaceae bacterium]CAK7260928.1 conserved protein of unknown function [Shinella sp. WSC3-e]
MTKLETQIYTHPPIPFADITPLEKLVLTHVLECSETDAGLVLFTDVGPNNPISVKRKLLLEAFRASAPQAESALNTFIASRVLALLPAPSGPLDMDAAVDIDLGAFPWPFIVQDIVSRSPTLSEVTVIQWMNHRSQRLETYGASVSLITATAIHHATSEDILARFRLQDRGLSLAGPLPASSLRTPASDGHRLLTVGEAEAALCIWEAMLYFRGLREDGRAVPDGIDQMSKLWDATGWQAMRLCALEIVTLVQDAYAALSGVLDDGGFTFDFDFVPAVVGTMRWSQGGPHREGEPEDFLESVMAAVRLRRQDVAAAALSASNAGR